MADTTCSLIAAAQREQNQQRNLRFRVGGRAQAVCPSNAFTSQQLDMRRKYEILRYKHQSSKTHLTKAQRYAQAARGTLTKNLPRKVLPSLLAGGTSCYRVNEAQKRIVVNSANDVVRVPTNNSDVPGPAQELFLDPAVPLTRYGNPQRRYNQAGDSLPRNT